MVGQYRILILLAVLSGALLLSSHSRGEEGIPLWFQADKNNLQILPQRFEYNLEDEDHVKIGDIIIDPTTFGFQVAATPNQPGKFKARFVWPSGLLREGTLSIKDNTGKAIWSAAISKKNTRLITLESSKSESSLGKTKLIEFVTDQLQEAFIEDMKFFPFMSFCIGQTSQDTSIYLCSKEVFLFSQNGKISIRSRSQAKRTAFVEINGKSVSNQGIIFLNDENANIGFRAMTKSGAILEIETRMKPVDFKDVVISQDKMSLTLTASGAQPVADERVKIINNETWQFQVDAERPILYLKGAGDIPMRQEFYIKGEVPSEKIRPYVSKDSSNKVYQGTLLLNGVAAKGTTVTAEAKDQKVEKLENNQFVWMLENIPSGKTSRHYLRVNDNKSSFVVAYDVFRGYALETGAFGSLSLSSQQLYGTFFVNWWIENFIGNIESWSRFHWGLRAEQTLVFNKKNNQPNLNTSRLELLWRANPGFHFLDSTWGLVLPYEVIQTNAGSASSAGIGAFFSHPPPKSLEKWMDWSDAKLVYLLGGGNDVRLNNAVIGSGLAYIRATDQLNWNYGLGLSRYAFDTGDSPVQIQILGGATYRF
ncbi:MAG: hypothetical protein IPM97_01995 [Bdellovibrionaceae bacterium]|nr:hypothetical protein [Pseudobdellovibrionaceae bacterium]